MFPRRFPITRCEIHRIWRRKYTLDPPFIVSVPSHQLEEQEKHKTDTFQPAPISQAPWHANIKPSRLARWSSYLPHERLHAEIVAFLNWARQDRRRRSQLTRTVETIEGFIKYNARGLRLTKEQGAAISVELYGSAAMNLQLPGGDFDIGVHLPPGVDRNRFLSRLSTLLRLTHLAQQSYFVKNAKVPVIDLLLRDGTHVDITALSEPNYPAMITKKVTELLAKEEYRAAKPLILVLKALLKAKGKGLNLPKAGGLGGYALVVMVLWFLKNHRMVYSSIYPLPSIPFSVTRRQTLGELLSDFLCYFGSVFPYVEYAISLEDEYRNGLVSKDKAVEISRSNNIDIPEVYDLHKFFVMCPVIAGNNLTYSTWRIDTVRKFFRDVHEQIEKGAGLVDLGLAKVEEWGKPQVKEQLELEAEIGEKKAAVDERSESGHLKKDT
ncbi:hypothetical protein Moror_10577 [Moniliophthora roreri MCA 2997]|uniref:Polymerase nucleotidyl transferase domain-containing protein n=2 Tax=Moniliophthora roreri TaxID=221103 RepID=V2WY21_MONRO|nr:hypothetical protein Moror_10577 [Moniliophthora roreri MCA 2997]KAI3613048.1 hypothetical protein WG66_001358 [Moniliophthora roreri]